MPKERCVIVRHFCGDKDLSEVLYRNAFALMKTTTVSYKNHKRIHKDSSEWLMHENNHEPIITMELWEKVREIEASVSRGKRDKIGELDPLSGLLYCDSCGSKMRQVGSANRKYMAYIKRWYHQNFYILDIAVIFNMTYDLQDKLNRIPKLQHQIGQFYK